MTQRGNYNLIKKESEQKGKTEQKTIELGNGQFQIQMK